MGSIQGPEPWALGKSHPPGPPGSPPSPLLPSATPATPAARSRHQVEHEVASQPRVLPDPAVCLAAASTPEGDPDYADCLVDRPDGCPFALRFGWGFYCQHPKRSRLARLQTGRRHAPNEPGRVP